MKKSILIIPAFLLSLLLLPSANAAGGVCPSVTPCCTEPTLIADGGGCPSGQVWIGPDVGGYCQVPVTCTSPQRFNCNNNTCYTYTAPACSTSRADTSQNEPCCPNGTFAVKNAASSTGWVCTDASYTGNVGIGIDNPQSPLHVPDGGRIGEVMIGEDGSNIDMAWEYESVGGNAPNFRLQSRNSILFHTGMTASEGGSSNAKARMIINTSGDVGIGLTNPADRLDINGVLRFNDSARRIYGDARGGRDAVVVDGEWDELEIKGRVIDWTGSNLHIGYDNDHIANSIDIGRNVGQIIFRSGGTAERMRINAAGNVGIGLTGPSYKLDVSGQANATELCIAGVCVDSWGEAVNVGGGGNLWTENGSNVYRSTGNVGIGDSSPSARLSVVGTIRASNAANESEYIEMDHGGSNAYINWAGDGKLQIRRTGTNLISIEQDGDVQIGENATYPALVVDSTGSGDNQSSQGARVSIGEGASGITNAAVMHMTYHGGGYGYVGSGALSTSSVIPSSSYLRFDYNSNNIYTPDKLTVAGNVDVDDGIYYLRQASGNNFGIGYGAYGGAELSIFSDNTITFTESDGSLERARFSMNTPTFNFDNGTLYIDGEDDEIGIGTDAPTHDLHVDSGGGSTIGFFVNGRMKTNGTNAGLWIDDGSSSDWFIGRESSSNGNLRFHNNGNRILIEPDGDIEVYNTNISGVNQLEINDPGEGILFNSTANISLEQSTEGDGYLDLITPDGYLRFGRGNGTWAHFRSDANNGFYFEDPVVVDGDISSYNEDLKIRADYNATASNNQLVLQTNGEVGINVGNPTARLDVRDGSDIVQILPTGANYGITALALDTGALLSNDRSVAYVSHYDGSDDYGLYISTSPNYGVYANAWQTAGYFKDTMGKDWDGNGAYTRLGYHNGTYNFSLYGNGRIYTSDDISVGGGVAAQGNIALGGHLYVDDNIYLDDRLRIHMSSGTITDFWDIEDNNNGDLVFNPENNRSDGLSAYRVWFEDDSTGVRAPAFNPYSDARLKNIHGDYVRGLDAIERLHPVEFTWKADGKDNQDPPIQVGLIAQDVQKIVPEAVSATEDEIGTLTINYVPMYATLVNAVKELKTENEELRAVVCELKPEAELCQQ